MKSSGTNTIFYRLRLLFIPLILLFIFDSALFSFENRFRLRPSRRHAAIVDSTIYPVSLTSPDAAFLKTNSAAVRRITVMDYTKKEVEIVLYFHDPANRSLSVNQDSLVPGIILSSYLFLELNDYITFVNSGMIADEFISQSPFFTMVDKKRKAFNPLDIEIPVKLPAWARRFVGSEGPRIRISGSIQLNAKGSSRWVAGEDDPTNTNEGIPNIGFDSKMEFTVQGKIGRLLDVNIRMDNTNGATSTGLGEQIKRQLKLHYKGETPDELEDDILQEVEAGYTGFSMQGEEFSGYSVTGSDGLFGVKARFKLGDLNITAVAAQENVKSENKKFNPKQQEIPQSRTEKDIAYDKMFFLDSLFREIYYNPSLPRKRIIRKVYLFRLDPMATDYTTNQTRYPNHVLSVDGPHKILRLEPDEYGRSDFYIDPNNRGFVVLSSALSGRDDQLLAWFEYSEDGVVKTSLSDRPDFFSVDGKTISPYTLRPQQMSSTSPQWKLMCKHVYDFGFIDEQNRMDIRLTISYRDQATQQYYSSIATVLGQKELISIFGFIDASNVLKTTDKDIFLFDYNAVIVPPDLGPEPFNSTALPADLPRNDGIYLYRSEDHTSKGVQDRYKIDLVAKMAATTFSLGVMDVAEGSEIITAGGVKLERDIDYSIMYDIGQISLISDRAINSMSDLTVEYQYTPFFNIDERTFLGLRADYQLENIGKGSNVAATFLRKAETGQDKRAQLGREPTSNMLLDVYANLSWEPEWMTGFVNLIPGIQTEQKSKFSIQGEVAKSIVNTNTSDRDEAVIDDFEDSKTIFPMGLSDMVWRWASPPDTSVIGWASPMQCWGGNGRRVGSLSDCGYFSWFSPPGVKENEIWPGSADLQSSATVLEFTMYPYTGKEGVPNGASTDFRKASWGGAMASLGYGVRDQLENSQYIEVWLKPVAGQRGMLHIDIGELSEDLRISPLIPGTQYDTTTFMVWNGQPDGKFNTEFFLGDNEISPRNDLGLDMRRDPFELFLMPLEPAVTTIPYAVVFDTIGINQTTDPGGDNYRYSNESADYTAYNGTQGNYSIRRQGADSEDLFNINGLVDRRNSYQHYWIDLSSSSSAAEPYFVTSNDKGWRLYRIPLHSRKVTGNAVLDSIPFKVNDPLLSKARGIRLWMNGLTGPSVLQFAKIEIVGNRWASNDSLASDTLNNPKMNVAVINTIDNATDYVRPSSDLVPVFLDNTSRTREREQSLDLRYDNVSADSREVKAERYYSRGMDFRLYQKLSLYYYPVEKTTSRGGNDGGRVKLFLRLGSDSLNFYEYRIVPKDARNWSTMEIDLSTLSTLKNDSIESMKGEKRPLRAWTDSTRVIGYPTFADIKWLAIGFMVDSNTVVAIDEKFSGRYYVNDLKLKEPQKLGGNAARVRMSADFADVFSFNSGVYYKDGAFLRLNEKQANGGFSEVALNASTSFALSRILPASWGISVPLSLSFTSSLQRPRYVPGSDVRLSTNGKDDGLVEMMPDLFRKISTVKNQDDSANKSESEWYETSRTQKTLSTAFKKSTISDNLAVNLLLDRVSLNAGWSEAESQSATKFDKTQSFNSNLSYSAAPRTEKALSPFSKIGDGFLKNNFGDLKLQWYPRSLDFTVYNASYSTTKEETRVNPKIELVELPDKRTMSVSHSYNLNYSGLLSWKYLRFDFTHTNSIDRNLNAILTGKEGLPPHFLGDYLFNVDTQWTLRSGGDITHFVLYGENRNQQTFNYEVNPSLFSWLTNRFTYGSTYGLSVNQGKIGGVDIRYLDLSLNTAMNTDFDWQFLSMVEKFNVGILRNKGDAIVKPVKSFLEKIGLTKLGFNYSVSNGKTVTGLKHIPLSQLEYLQYKSGLYATSLYNVFTGRDDPNSFGGRNYNITHNDMFADPNKSSATDGRSVDITGTSSTSLNLPLPIRVSLSLSTTYGKKWAEQFIYATADTTFSFPNITISGNASDALLLFKYIPLAGDFIQSAGLNSSFTYKKDYTQKISRDDAKISWGEYSLSFNYNPLYRLNLQLKNRIAINNELTYAIDRTYNTGRKPLVRGIERTTWSNKTSLTYSIAKQQPIKILVWEFSFNNQLGLNFDWQMGASTEYEWDVIVDDKIFESYGDYAHAKNSLEHKSRLINNAVSAGFSYDVTSTVKAGGLVSWKKDLKVFPGTDDDNSINHPQYNIVVDIWVKWTFR